MKKKQKSKPVSAPSSRIRDSSERNAFTPDQKSNPTTSDLLIFQLIRFDKKAIIFIAICLVLYILFTSLKWHNSSIGTWNEFIPDGGDPDRGIIVGKPLPIRSDEWQVYASFILAQHEKDFPLTNEALGFGKTPLTFGLPTDHVLSKIKPTFWGYYLLDIERAFSWHWNFKIFPFLIAAFLLLMLFTRNRFWLSVIGSIWLLLSSAIQWWSINTEIFTFGILSVVSFIYILYAEKPRTILLNGLILVLSAFCFAMVLYPAYQVPLAYFLLALAVGYLLKNKNYFLPALKQNSIIRIATLAGSFVLLLALFFLFFHETKETVDVVSNTVYPGKRNEAGGHFSFLRLFTDNFSLFMNENKFPPKWGNICELSSYLLLFPIASVVAVAGFIKSKKIDALILSLVIFQAFMLTWILVGLPEFLANVTFLKASPSFRALFVYGFANVVSAVIFLSNYKSSILKDNLLTKVITFLVLITISYGINYFLNKEADSFFTSIQVLIASFVFAALNWSMLYFYTDRNIRIAFFTILFLFLLPNIGINPLAQGLAPYYENKLYRSVSAINAKDPGTGWVVFGSYTTPNFLKAAGINCFNGVQFAPPLEKLKVFDTDGQNLNIYNRYAHIAFTSFIDSKETVQFELRQNDLYYIRMDPCSPRLVQLGLKYIMFTYPPNPVEVECLDLIEEVAGNFIYKRNESWSPQQ